MGRAEKKATAWQIGSRLGLSFTAGRDPRESEFFVIGCRMRLKRIFRQVVAVLPSQLGTAHMVAVLGVPNCSPVGTQILVR